MGSSSLGPIFSALKNETSQQTIWGALLLIGLAGIVPIPASAGTYYDAVCNCRRPDSEYNTRRYERAAPRAVTRERVVDHTRVVRGNTRLIQENRLIVHVRPVINREVVVHRTNTIVKDIVLHKVNATNKVREEFRHEVVNRYASGSVRHVTERRGVRGVKLRSGRLALRRRAGFIPLLDAKLVSIKRTRLAGIRAGRFCFRVKRATAPNGARQIRLIGMAPRKSRLPTSTPHCRTSA